MTDLDPSDRPVSSAADSAAVRPSEQVTPLKLKERLAASAGGAALDALMSTCRYRREGVEHYDQFWRQGKPVIFTSGTGGCSPVLISTGTRAW